MKNKQKEAFVQGWLGIYLRNPEYFCDRINRRYHGMPEWVFVELCERGLIKINRR